MNLRQTISALLHGEGLDSCIGPEESVLFFPTAASLDASGGWRIPIHGWIYQPAELSHLRRFAFHLVQHLVHLRFPEADLSTPLFRERLSAFLVDNERNNRVEIVLGTSRFTLHRSRPNGHFQGTLDVAAEDLPLLFEGTDVHPPAWLTFRAVTRSSDPRAFHGQVLFLPPHGISVISDIDDTIKVTEVLDRRRMLANTFLHEFHEVQGMADLYQQWGRARHAAFHYVSASPWHLYPFLSEFLRAQNFPRGTFHLRDFRLMPRDLLSTLRPSRRLKYVHIRRLLQQFPQRRFVLMGDSGEADAPLYAQIARAFPTQIERIFIRHVDSRAPLPRQVERAQAQLPASLLQVFSRAEDLFDRAI